MIDSIIFDVDGTFWDSTAIVARAWNKVLAEQTSMTPNLTPLRLKQLFGRTLPDIAAILFAGESKERQLSLIDACAEEEHRALLQTPAPLYEGLRETIVCLSQSYPLYIVSNCEAGYIEVFLEATGMGSYFKGHLCPGDTGNAKASNIAQIVRENQLNAPVYVGDTQGDCTASYEAGVPFIHAAYGFGTCDRCIGKIEKPLDLVSLLHTLNE